MYFEGNNRDYYKQFKISHIEKNKKKILGHSDTNQNNQAKRYSRKWRKKLKINKAKKKYLRKKKNELIKDFKVYAPHNIVDAAFEAKLKRIKKKNRKYYRHHAKTQFGQSAWNAERTAHQRARDKRERKEKRKKGGKKKFGGLIVIADDDYNKEEIRELHFQLRIFVELIYEHLEHIKKLVLRLLKIIFNIEVRYYVIEALNIVIYAWNTLLKHGRAIFTILLIIFVIAMLRKMSYIFFLQRNPPSRDQIYPAALDQELYDYPVVLPK